MEEGKDDEALYVFQALESLESLDASCYGLVACIACRFEEKERFADAVRILEHSVGVGESRKKTDREMLCRVMTKLGESYIRIHSWKKAVYRLERAMTIFPNYNTANFLAIATTNMEVTDTRGKQMEIMCLVRECMETALSIDPDNKRIKDELHAVQMSMLSMLVTSF